MENIDAKETLQAILQNTNNFQQIADAYTSSFNFYGHSLDEWADRFTLELPEHMDQIALRNSLIRLANLMQLAHNYLSISNSLCDAFTGASEMQKAELVRKLVDSFATENRKRPAANVIEQMADAYMANPVSIQIASEIVKNFWDQRIKALESLRKILEQIGFSLAAEAKYQL